MIDAMFSRLRCFDSSNKSGRCGHVQRLNTKDFKRRVSDKFAIDRTQSGLQLACEICQSKKNLWICLNCCRVLCINEGEHAIAHRSARRGCDLLLSCEDSHVLCCPCEKYLYPREIAGSAEHERALTPAVEAWLQVLGRSRNWWREMESSSAPGCHGLRNFGNTCFFTSTVQALLHSRPLSVALKTEPKAEGGEIQKALLSLRQEYWDEHQENRDEEAIDPRKLWDAVVTHAVFGEYSEMAMEDANTLLLDVLDSLNEEAIQATFGVRVNSQTNCSICSRRRRAASILLQRLFPVLPARACDAIAECAAGAPFNRSSIETILSLPLVSEAVSSGEAGEKAASSNLAEQARVGMVGTCEGEATLAELLGAYLAPEWVSDFKCENCNTRGKVLKRFSIQDTSDALVFNLKRFAPTASGSRIKVHRKVVVPLILDLATLLGSEHLGVYELCSLVVHDGGMGGGHYMAYVRQRRGSTLSSEWLWFSDQHFGPVDADEVFNSEPFLVFYERTPIKLL